MRKTTLILALAVAFGAFSQQKVSILGDSYSTFGGALSPEWNLAWYNGPDGGFDKPIDVKDVQQTWWWILANDNGLTIERNNSFSGSTVCTTGYGGADYSDRAFCTRTANLGEPDIILIFGGTNDSWAGVPFGEYKYGEWTKEDLKAFRPAFACMISSLKQLYPEAQIYSISNTDLKDEIVESMDVICDAYGIENIHLHDIDKQWGHPSAEGMKAIAAQVGERLRK